MKIFRGVRVFEYALWQKKKAENAGKPTKSFLTKRRPLLTFTTPRKLLKSHQFVT